MASAWLGDSVERLAERIAAQSLARLGDPSGRRRFLSGVPDAEVRQRSSDLPRDFLGPVIREQAQTYRQVRDDVRRKLPATALLSRPHTAAASLTLNGVPQRLCRPATWSGRTTGPLVPTAP